MEPLKKKIRDFLGVFPKCRTPPNPPPPYLGGLRPIFFGLFCILGPKKHFWFSQKCSLIVSILTYTFGNWGPFLPFISFSKIKRLRPQIQLPLSVGKNSQINPVFFLKAWFQFNYSNGLKSQKAFLTCRL